MPLEPKPLFRAHVVEAAMAGFEPPPLAGARGVLGRWASRIRSGQLAVLSEKQLLPDFFTDVFYRLLGYRGPDGPGEAGAYTFSRELYVEVDGQVADAALGRFGEGEARVLAVVEGKGPTDPLERPHGGRRMSAVDQAYRYAINLRCDWLLVTNCREVRLYHKASDQRTYERFEVVRLASDEAELARFVFVLGPSAWCRRRGSATGRRSSRPPSAPTGSSPAPTTTGTPPCAGSSSTACLRPIPARRRSPCCGRPRPSWIGCSSVPSAKTGASCRPTP